jgi:hypothetical protein
MRKILLISLLTITLVSCAQKKEVENFTEVNSTEELFKLKSKINETNSVDFLKHFYVVSVVEEFQNNSPKKNELIKEFDKIIKDNINFSCIEINKNKVVDVLKKCNSKEQLIKEISENKSFFYDSELEEGIRNYEIIKLTEQSFAIYGKVCGGNDSDKYLLISDIDKNTKDFILGESYIDKKTKLAIEKLQSDLKTKFTFANPAVLNYGSAKINGEDYITTAYVEGEIESFRPIYNLIIACNLKNNKIFYLYDSPKSENDNWKHDVETLDGAEFSWVTEKNPDWKQLD